MRIKGILWDNDGLLVDSERIYFEANRQVLLQAGIRLTREIFADVSLRQGLGLMDLAARKGKPRGKSRICARNATRLHLSLLQKKAFDFSRALRKRSRRSKGPVFAWEL